MCGVWGGSPHLPPSTLPRRTRVGSCAWSCGARVARSRPVARVSACRAPRRPVPMPRAPCTPAVHRTTAAADRTGRTAPSTSRRARVAVGSSRRVPRYATERGCGPGSASTAPTLAIRSAKTASGPWSVHTPRHLEPSSRSSLVSVPASPKECVHLVPGDMRIALASHLRPHHACAGSSAP